MSEIEKLEQRLKEMGVKTLHPFYGPEAHKCTPEQLAAEMNKVLDQLERGDTKEVFDLEYFLDFNSHEQRKRFYTLYPPPFCNTYGLLYQDDIDIEVNLYLTKTEEYEALLEQRHAEFMKNETDNGL